MALSPVAADIPSLAVELLVLGIFTAEMVAKIVAECPKPWIYWSDGPLFPPHPSLCVLQPSLNHPQCAFNPAWAAGWNCMDSGIVVVGLADVVMGFAGTSMVPAPSLRQMDAF